MSAPMVIPPMAIPPMLPPNRYGELGYFNIVVKDRESVVAKRLYTVVDLK